MTTKKKLTIPQGEERAWIRAMAAIEEEAGGFTSAGGAGSRRAESLRTPQQGARGQEGDVDPAMVATRRRVRSLYKLPKAA